MTEPEDQEENPYSFPTEYGVQVYRTQQDMVALSQEQPLGEPDHIVVISPERVDLVIQWLQAVRDEIHAERAASNHRPITR